MKQAKIIYAESEERSYTFMDSEPNPNLAISQNYALGKKYQGVR